MRILGSSVAITNQHTLTSVITRKDSLRVWADGAGAVATRAGPTGAMSSGIPGGPTSLSGGTKARGSADLPRKARAAHADDLVAPDLPADERGKVLLLEALLKALFGKQVKVRIETTGDQERAASAKAIRTEETAPGQVRQGWGLEYDCRVSSEESETLRFAAHGVVRTADGNEISFSAYLELSRTFMAEAGISIRAGDARLSDPLVINYNGLAADLTGAKLAFDLDADGARDQIPFVGSGSGFLALDLNGDGAVNDGTELFGPTTGNAFAELAAHDSDGNLWIDESDPVYERLRVWTRDASGVDLQLPLGQVGIGAVYLGNVEAPFSVRDQGNRLLAENRRVGIFVREDGSAGTTQQIDLAV